MANAGVGPPGQTMKAMDLSVFERTLEIDLLGVVRTVHPALEPIAAARGPGGGHLIGLRVRHRIAGHALRHRQGGGRGPGPRRSAWSWRPTAPGATVAHFGFVDTSMVQEATEKSERDDVLESLPAFVRRRLTPAQAATALVDGIERRAPRVIAPGWWKVPYYLRGVFGPLMDKLTSRDERVLQAMREGDVPDPEARHTSTAG